MKSSLNQTQLIPLFSLIVLCKERVFPIRLLTPAVALSDLLGCRNEIIDCTITQLVVRDSAVLNEHTNCVVEVSWTLPSYLRLSHEADVCKSGIFKCKWKHETVQMITFVRFFAA